MRAVAVVAACWLLLLGARLAAADTVESAAHQLGAEMAYKVRLAAALSLSKSRDPRAVIALAGALRDDESATIRRVAALALEKMVDARTAIDARELALGALETAAAKDIDQKVRDTATKVLRVLSELRTKAKPRGDKPSVYVNVDSTTDQSRQLPSGAGDRLTRIVKQRIEGKGYTTVWPNGGQPTSAELSSSRSRAFIVASTVKKIDVQKSGSQTQIACTLVVRVAPWTGKDGGERWEANRAASASGSAKATTGLRDRDIQNGMRDCLEAVADDVTSRQVVPFIAHLASSGS